jgi:heterodisulfide reductase subunit C2
MGSEMEHKPHDLMRLVATGQARRAAEDESIWLCLTCETCSARCPNDCDPAGVIDSLREVSIETGVADAPRRIAAFHRAFLAQIKNNGRLHEMAMVVDYKLRSGDLMKDVTNAPGMVTRGKLSLRPHRIRDIAEVKRIFERCGEA